MPKISKVEKKNVTIRNMRVNDWEWLYTMARKYDVTMADMIHYAISQFRFGADHAEDWTEFFFSLNSDQRKTIRKFFTEVLPTSPMKEEAKFILGKLEKIKEIPYKKVKEYIKLKSDMEINDFLNLGFYASKAKIKKAREELRIELAD